MPCCGWRVGVSNKTSVLAQEESHARHGRPSSPPRPPRQSVLLTRLWQELSPTQRDKTLQALSLILKQELEPKTQEVADESH